VSQTVHSLGIDIEVVDPRRNWPELLGWFAPNLKDKHLSSFQGAIGWTFHEAYYKAKGLYVPPDLLSEVVSKTIAVGNTLTLSEGAHAVFFQPSTTMMGCIYWEVDQPHDVLFLPDITPNIDVDSNDAAS
jgi:phosphopantetheinyl transferase